MPDETHTTVYTDGSCNTQHKIGAWVAIVFAGGKKVLLSGSEEQTTNNRMELTAVIKAIEHIQNLHGDISICIYTDSQYVAGLQARKEKLAAAGFTNSKGTGMTNAALVKSFYGCAGNFNISMVKVKAHQKKNDIANHNIEADILVRKIVREAVESVLA